MAFNHTVKKSKPTRNVYLKIAPHREDPEVSLKKLKKHSLSKETAKKKQSYSIVKRFFA